jgi:hypothetical protein
MDHWPQDSSLAIDGDHCASWKIQEIESRDTRRNHFRRDFFFAPFVWWGVGGVASIRFMTSRARREVSSGARSGSVVSGFFVVIAGF